MFVRISNTPRDYAWGSSGRISEYLGLGGTGTEAELWLGTHPGSPAKAADGRPLGELLDAAGVAHPPFLLKVLAAASPLSLQAHPTTEQAERGFARENDAGVDMSAPHRSYKDPFAKPEIIVAVSKFEALSGLRDADDALAAVRAVLAVDEAIRPFARRLEGSLQSAVAWLLSGDAGVAEVVRAVTDAVDAIAEHDAAAADTVRRLAQHYPGDPGIAVSLLLNRVTLEPGEALFLPAGNIHAYLEGLGIELMGPSDNVLRAGLTSKHVDAAELLQIADFSVLHDPRMPREQLAGATRYAPDAAFELRWIDGVHRPDASGPAIVLAVAETEVAFADERHTLTAGEAAYFDTLSGVEFSSADAWLAMAGDTPVGSVNP